MGAERHTSFGRPKCGDHEYNQIKGQLGPAFEKRPFENWPHGSFAFPSPDVAIEVKRALSFALTLLALMLRGRKKPKEKEKSMNISRNIESNIANLKKVNQTSESAVIKSELKAGNQINGNQCEFSIFVCDFEFNRIFNESKILAKFGSENEVITKPRVLFLVSCSKKRKSSVARWKPKRASHTTVGEKLSENSLIQPSNCHIARHESEVKSTKLIIKLIKLDYCNQSFNDFSKFRLESEKLTQSRKFDGILAKFCKSPVVRSGELESLKLPSNSDRFELNQGSKTNKNQVTIIIFEISYFGTIQRSCNKTLIGSQKSNLIISNMIEIQLRFSENSHNCHLNVKYYVVFLQVNPTVITNKLDKTFINNDMEKLFFYLAAMERLRRPNNSASGRRSNLNSLVVRETFLLA